MNKGKNIDIESLRKIFNSKKDKLLCTANSEGIPNVCIMGNPKVVEDGSIEFDINGKSSVTLDNLKENNQITFIVYLPGEKARDYKGVRVYAEAIEINVSGEKFEAIKNMRRLNHGEARAAALLAHVVCNVKRLRPIVDRGQLWTEAP